MRLTRKQNVLLTVGAVAGSLCLLSVLMGALFGIKPLMFKSGSMEPTIATGGLALSVPVEGDDIRVGDIVSTENSTGTRITHRVAAVAPADGYTELTLKGDANSVVDAEVYAVSEVDRVFWSAPLLGYAVAWLSSPVTLFLGGLLTAYLLYVAFGPRSRRDSHDGRDADEPTPSAGRRARRPGRRRRGRSLRQVVSMTLATTVIITGGALDVAAPALAQFNDTATAASTFTAGKLATPQDPKCVLRGGLLGIGDGIVLSWSYSGVVPTVGYALTVDGSARDASMASIDLRARDASVSIRARNEAWRSQPLNVSVDYDAGLLGLGASVSCTVV